METTWKISVGSLWTIGDGGHQLMRITAMWIEYDPDCEDWEPYLQAVSVLQDGTEEEAKTYEMTVWVHAAQPVEG